MIFVYPQRRRGKYLRDEITDFNLVGAKRHKQKKL